MDEAVKLLERMFPIFEKLEQARGGRRDGGKGMCDRVGGGEGGG